MRNIIFNPRKDREEITKLKMKTENLEAKLSNSPTKSNEKMATELKSKISKLKSEVRLASKPQKSDISIELRFWLRYVKGFKIF